MGLFNMIGGGSDPGKKSRSLSEINNLKRKIAYEEERINEIFVDIGRAYYKNQKEKPNMEELNALCDDIEKRKKRIKRLRFELKTGKGVTICPNCKSEVSDKFQMCPNCGESLSAEPAAID